MKCRFTIHGGRWSLGVCVGTELLHSISGVSVWVWFFLSAVKGVSTWNFLCYNSESHLINLIWIFTIFHAPTHYILAVMVWIEWLHRWNCSLVFAINVCQKKIPDVTGSQPGNRVECLWQFNMEDVDMFSPRWSLATVFTFKFGYSKLKLSSL